MDHVAGWVPGRSRPADVSPLSDRTVARVERKFRQNFRRALEQAPPEAPIRELDRLLAAEAIANDPTHGLRERVDQTSLKARLKESLSDPALQKQLAELRRQSVEQDGAVHLIAEQKRFLAGQPFYERLQGLEEGERGALLQSEFDKLATLDPEAAAKAGGALLDRDWSAGVMQRLRGSDPEQLASGLRVAAQAAQQPLSPGAARTVARALKITEGVGDLASVAQNVTQIVAQLKAESPEYLDEALTWVGTLDDQGLLSTVLTGTSLLTAFEGRLETPKEKLELASRLISAGGSASEVARLPVIAGVLTGTQFADTLLATSQVLGPVGSALGAGLNSFGAYESFVEGDLGKAGGLAASALGSSLILGSPFAGPLAPALVVGGAALSIGGLVVGRTLSKERDRELLQEMKLLLPEPEQD